MVTVVKNEQLLSAFSYISILFCPLIVPIVVYFAQKDDFVRFHAKRAIIGQSIVVVSALFAIFAMLIGGVTGMIEQVPNMLLVIGFGITTFISIVVSIWSIVMTVRVFH